MESRQRIDTIGNLRLERCRVLAVEPMQDDVEGEERVVDPAGAVGRALAQPVDFPPFAKAIVPGDRVAIALDEAVPCADRIVLGVIEFLKGAQVDAEAVTVLVADEDLCCFLQSRLEDVSQVRLVRHDPSDGDALCFFGMSKSQVALRIHRAVFDADVVLPIGCGRSAAAADSRGVFESLYPRFSDVEAIRRHRTPSNLFSESGLAELRCETDEAGWLLGVPLVLQVVPGPDGTVADVIAGIPGSLARHVDVRCRGLWSRRIAHQSSLVIAVMSGETHEQSWHSFAQTVATAQGLVEDGGALAICSDLARAPGKSLRRLAEGDDLDVVGRHLQSDDGEDSWPAWQLARALQNGPVYLMSRLDSDMVEDLGIAPVADWEELSRLANRHETCVVLDNSQHVVANVVAAPCESTC